MPAPSPRAPQASTPREDLNSPRMTNVESPRDKRQALNRASLHTLTSTGNSNLSNLDSRLQAIAAQYAENPPLLTPNNRTLLSMLVSRGLLEPDEMPTLTSPSLRDSDRAPRRSLR